MTPGNKRRFEQLLEAGRNLGLREDHARFYATEALNDELKRGDWRVTPLSAEAISNDTP